MTETGEPFSSLADVALPAPLRAGDRAFTFAVPPALDARAVPGVAVRVPFGRRTVTGFVIGRRARSERQVRAIAALDERVPPLPADLVALASWMADHHVCSVGEALWTMIPPLEALGGERTRRAAAALADAAPAGQAASRGAHRAPSGGPLGVAALLERDPRARIAVIADEERFAGYLEALRWVEAGDGSAIILVPEVVQAEAMAAWVSRRSALPAALLHGELGGAERWRLFRRIAAGEVRLVVGTRSAVFAPLPRLRLIVVDHEEDASYKEERTPRYHARRVAEERAARSGAALIWGTPVPSLEVMRAVLEGRAAAVRRAAARAPVTVTDARAEAGGGLFGAPLAQALRRALPRERAIVFVPRRGYADFLLCHECGWVPRCPRCAVAMTYHVRGARLRCHLCGTEAAAPEVCAVCGGTTLRPHGVGTERVEAAARRLFRGAPVHRLDTSAAPDEPAQRRVWQQFRRRGGLLIGTQLLVKGVGQVPAAVVGAIGVDAGLHLPDFRAAERTYQVLARLRALVRREMIVQTFTPGHPALRALAGDADAFYRDELAARERFGYPPFRTLINVIVAAPDAAAARAGAERIAGAVRGGEVLGPSPAPLARVRGRARWQLLIKEHEPGDARAALAAVWRDLELPRRVAVVVDVDPVDVL